MTNKIGNGSIPLRIGNLINATVYGGSYTQRPGDMFGVKMAVEIKADHDVDIPTEDFNVPEVSDLRVGVVKALMAMITGRTVYAGCWGGIGRTGIFLAALAKVQIEYRRSKHRAGRGEDPVLYVRKHFIPHALETDEQIKYIVDLDVSSIVSWLDATQTALGLGGFTTARPVDADCVTLPNGDCVAEVECMHGPATETGRILAAQPSESNVPKSGFPASFRDDEAYNNFKAAWKDHFRGRVSQFAEELPDTDSGDSENLQLQIMNLEERVDTLHGSLIDSVEVMKLMQGEHKALTKNVGDLIHATQIGFQEVLTKQTWREKIRQYFERIANYHF